MCKRYGTAGHVTDDSIIWRMRIACWITEATGTHSEYVIRTAFPLEQCLREDDHKRWTKYVGRLQRL
jgi:hypothetical protein